MSPRRVLKDLWVVKKTLIILLTPLVFLPLGLQVESREARCAYGLAIMAVYWITESLPLSATALLPVVLFPMMGVLPVKAVCRNYMKDTSMFGLGCLSFAIAVEEWNLHKRIALKTLLLMGSHPKWLMLGFMLPTWFLSMWVNNTSATAMMIPIVDAVLVQLRSSNHTSDPDNDETTTLTLSQHDTSISEREKLPNQKLQKSMYDDGREKDSHSFRRLCKGITLCVAYAANIGGTGSLSGTSPNLIMKGQADILFEEYGLESGVTFTSWMIFALPGSALCLICAWLWLSFFFLGKRNWFQWRCRSTEAESGVQSTLKQQYKELGPLSFAEVGVIGHFLLLVLLWLSRKPPVVTGWGAYFPYVGDSAAAILVCVSMYFFPAHRPRVFGLRKDQEAVQSVPSLLNWSTVQRKYPWGILLLLGGGFALADVCEKSGLSRWIGGELSALGSLEPWLMNLLLTLLIALCTEITSNAATAALLLPILAQLAMNLSINPLYLMFSCAICTSFAFMLPVATPPNAIVFSNGHLEVKDMIQAGSVMNILCVAVLNVAANTWGTAYFNLGVMPVEFSTNSTAVDVVVDNVTLPN
ncbi:Na(+)/citrate cotransporter-like [Haliotis asinina]|uniref:Na(+)/citrate cotransporter-like n=1 Tax=Haliotis asinina TaxID=109174 RepID=UPI0035323B6E